MSKSIAYSRTLIILLSVAILLATLWATHNIGSENRIQKLLSRIELDKENQEIIRERQYGIYKLSKFREALIEIKNSPSIDKSVRDCFDMQLESNPNRLEILAVSGSEDKFKRLFYGREDIMENADSLSLPFVPKYTTEEDTFIEVKNEVIFRILLQKEALTLQ